jgi:branched-chain amino acid transport system substrate-binding protein
VSDVVNLVSSGQPNLLYLPLFEPEANLIINNLPEESNVFLLGSDNLLLSSFAESTGVAVRGMAITGAAVTGAGYDAFLDEWLVRYGSEPTLPYQAYAYDATNILLNAIEAVAVVGRNDALLIGRQALRQAISQIQLEGLTGELACTTTECSRPAAIGVYELTDEQISGTAWPPPLLWSATNSTQP